MNQVNFGYSSRSIYDEQAYSDKLVESVGPGNYILNTNRIYNCAECLPTIGPRSSRSTVSTAAPHTYAMSQQLTDIESILTNRNVILSKTKNGKVNNIDIDKINMHHLKLCDNGLNPMSSKLSFPVQNYRDLPVNRFYDLQKNPQEAIFWDFSANTKLEATDNFFSEKPTRWVNDNYPQPIEGVVNNVFPLGQGAYCRSYNKLNNNYC